ncbi:helix-turn-helix domain-containing protein [Lacticaseibacillus nasuensis]|uniref:helix-turn-helix domain-containing protein n=1 Tax=Lacticaseibacillus nasuensis TaxID=944671 RepID=UPI0022456E48|nr:helix-turn-helix transcriptional regulator [Lacticaseibacillus nasuensis]MCX2456173.1 helix-turn-helix transcriptional regulator [Lacticaseibacillus nasuensis]
MDQAQVNETLQRLSAQLNRTTSGSPAFRQLAAQEEAIVFADLDVHAWGFLQAALGRPLVAAETAAVIAAASHDQPISSVVPLAAGADTALTVRVLRHRRDWTQAHLAEAARVSVAQVQAIETADAIDLTALQRVLVTLGRRLVVAQA